jgi:hypothetical protein
MKQNSGNDETGRRTSSQEETTWGPKLFLGVAVAILTFFWWLLIYSGGVTPHH